MNHLEIMKQALDVLLHLQPDALTSFYTIGSRDKVIKHLHNAIAKMEKQSPVVDNKFTRAWINLSELPGGMMQGPQGLYGPVSASTACWITTSESERDRVISKGEPVLEIYTHPQPKREPLTFEQVEDCYPEGPSVFEDPYGENHTSPRWLHDFARNIQAMHNIKSDK